MYLHTRMVNILSHACCINNVMSLPSSYTLLTTYTMYHHWAIKYIVNKTVRSYTKAFMELCTYLPTMSRLALCLKDVSYLLIAECYHGALCICT